MKKLSPQYVAGFTDGEGYIGIVRVNRPRRIFHRPVIEIGNTNQEIIEALANQFDGYIGTSDANRSQRIYTFRLSGAEKVANFLRYVGRHLIVKRSQYEVMEKFLATFNQKNAKSLPKSVEDKREDMRTEIKQLNLRVKKRKV